MHDLNRSQVRLDHLSNGVSQMLLTSHTLLPLAAKNCMVNIDLYPTVNTHILIDLEGHGVYIICECYVPII